MASESKKRKADCDTHNRYARFTDRKAVKEKGKLKRVLFFNSAQRMAEKEELIELRKEI